MKKMIQAGLLWGLCAISVCFAQNIPRQPPEKFVVGTTLRKQVTDEYGAPGRQGQSLMNGQAIWSLSYAAGGETPRNAGVVPARVHTFHFFKDLLVGYEFLSTIDHDHTDFEERKVGEIVKNKSTREDVVRLMGRPGGQLMHPMIQATTGDALTWAYVEMRRGFGSIAIARKRLTVFFDANGVVVDVDYTSGSS